MTIARRLAADRAFAGGAVIVFIMVTVALAAPALVAWEGQDPTTFHNDLLDSARGGVPLGSLGGISGEHWLGVEPGTGRDLFARVVHGARASLTGSAIAVGVGVTIGSLIGALAGWFGGLTDTLAMRFIEI